MTADEKFDYVCALLNGSNESEVESAVIEAQLLRAGDAILNRLYPTGEWLSDEVPVRYHVKQCELAMRYINRMGAEGEERHVENGIDRVYSTVDDLDILSTVVPYAKVNK